ncbi:MAG: hypothetical protein JXR37_29120 [Kiritimatiellae bacterium]|nr:hypothetical protein [Kiritimatiellia bacterium]
MINRTFIVLALALACVMPQYGMAGNADIGVGLVLSLANGHFEAGSGLLGYGQLSVSDAVSLRGTLIGWAGDTEADVLSAGDYRVLGGEGAVLIHITPAKGLMFHAGGGAGFYTFEHEVTSDVEALMAFLGGRLEEEIEDTFGFHLLAGASLALGDSLGLFCEARYLVMSADIEVTVTDLITFEVFSASDSIDLNTASLVAGGFLRF